MPGALRRLVAPLLLATFAAVAVTVFVVALVPGAFFQLTTVAGEPVRRIAFPGVGAMVGLALIFGAVLAGAFLWLRRTAHFPLVAVVVAVAGVQAGAYTAYQLWEFHETPEFCVRTCHVMEPTYLSFAEPGRNLVMQGHLENGTAACLDCHTGPGVGGQLDLMATSARHIWKYAITGDYDPKDLGRNGTTVPDENCTKCHQEGLKGELPQKHDRFTEQCGLCHSPHDANQTGYAFPESILKVDECSRCHRDAPLDFVLNPTGHSAVAQDDCQNCHRGHGTPEKNPEAVKGCTAQGCHDEDAANNVSLTALDHLVFEEEDCATCHGKAHDLQPLRLDALRDACTDCHEGQALFIDPLNQTWDLHVNVTNLYSPHLDATGDPVKDCTACHGTSPPVGQPASLGAHGGLRCLECHRSGNALGAPPPTFQPVGQSQVSWMRQNGRNFANWTTDGRGSHDARSDCGDCHAPHAAPTPVFPEGEDSANCGSSCHAWLQEPVVQAGFRGVSGPTVYRGNLDPETLLEKYGKAHKEIYEELGCTGLCHNPETTMAVKESWAPGGPPPPINATTIHGYVNQCTDCHLYESPLGGPDDLHSTHIPFVQAEKPIADPGGPDEACNYCHDSGPYPENQSGGCYNCHLSGHSPETFYWNIEPEGRPTRPASRPGRGRGGPGPGGGDRGPAVAGRLARPPLHGGNPAGGVRVVLREAV